MNRKFLGLMATAFAFCSTASCSDNSASDITGLAHSDSTGVGLNDSTAGEARGPSPSGVADLQASATGSASVTLSFTQVNDGTGQPARYDVRYAVSPIAWGSAPSVNSGTCSTPVAGTAVGSPLSCTVLGLTASTSYNFQLVSYRGTMNLNAVYGPLSNIASATTTSGTAPPPPPPAPVASVTVTPTSATLAIGATVQLQVSAFDANNNPLTGRVVTSSSADPGIASVSSAGLVTAVSAGTTQITVASEGKTAVATITVSPTPPAPVATVTVSPASLSVQPGATAQFSAVTRDASNNILTGRSIAWSSSNTSAATISASGLITALAAGTTTITASSEGKTGTAALTVTQVPVASVTVSPTSASLLIGATVQLLVTARDANNNVLTGRVVTSSSASSGVATVTSLGVVRGVSVGTTQVTVTVEGKTATSTITVTAPPPAAVATVTVTPAAASLQVGATAQLAASMRDVNNNVLTGRVVTWSSANTAIATVNSSGVVSAVSAGGPVQITATSETKTGTSAITVTAAPPPPPPGGWRAHEPAGMTTLTDQGFTSLPSNGWTGWFNYDIASDATGPRSPGGAFENIYPAGMSGGINPGLAEYQFSPRKTLYVSMYVKHSANFQGHASSVNKIIHIWIGGLNHLFLNAAGTGSGALRGQVRLQGIAGGGNFDGGTAGIYDNGVNMTRNQWHLLEVIAVANTGSNKDGSVSLYVDGVLAATCSGIEFEGNAPSWNLVKIDPTWGGTGDRVTSAMSIRVDQIYMSGK